MSIFSYSREKQDSLISRQAMVACEHVITEMGAELHDDLVQKLAVLRISVDKLERSIHDPEEADRLMIVMRSELSEAIHSVRRISRQLISYESPERTFQENMAMLCQDMERPDMSAVHFDATGDEQPLGKLAKTFLLRVVQELIHNAQKHSSAWHVWVTLTWHPNNLLIVVEDDGTNVSKIQPLIDRLRTKHGSLKMRAQAIGAAVQFEKGKNGLLVRILCNLKHEDPPTNP